MRILSVLLLSLLLPLNSFSKPETTITSKPTIIDRVAIAALKDARNQPDGDLYEYGGVIVLRGGAYQYPMLPVSQKRIDGVHVNPEDFMQPGDKLVAVYHTHPCMPITHFPGLLSLPDVIMPLYLGVPQYMLDECTGLVHTFDWKKDKIKDTCQIVSVDIGDNKSKPLCLPVGRIVGDIHQTAPNMDLIILKWSHLLKK